MSNLPNHLGGHAHITHVDQGALDFLIELTNAKSYLDIGCGPGGMVDLAISKGLTALGIDGDFTLVRNYPENFIIHDYTVGPTRLLDQIYDIGWSCEFLEHVEEVYMDNYMDTFKYCRYIAVTHAFPGQHGHHHVNLQNPNYWLNKFAQYGFIQEVEATKTLRERSTMEQNYVRDSGLVFKNLELV